MWPQGPRPRQAAGLREGIGEQRVGETGSNRVGNLERLDHVVHDFMACLQEGLRVPLEGAGSENVVRFLRILVHASPAQGPVLGAPVLCGMSPPIGIESLLGFLASLRKTGVLRVRTEETTFMISVVRGDVVHGVCDPRPEPELLGNILVARGAVRPEALRRFFERCGSSPSKIVEGLNREELVSTEDLQAAMGQQVQQLFDRLLAARSAEWCFHEGEATLSFVNMRVNINRVLLESARKHDEEQAQGPAQPPLPRKPLELVWPTPVSGRRPRRRPS